MLKFRWRPLSARADVIAVYSPDEIYTENRLKIQNQILNPSA
jgi:hypothetical protein